jgi:phosphoribosyl 1,2-cyclic phosphate phosphodiesterase
MNFLVTGSGGALRIPNATCQCATCREARARGVPYKRLGQSLYLREIAALFDASEDVNEAINAYSVARVDLIFITHWHPDHTAGIRVIEALHAASGGKRVEVFLPPGGLDFSINGNSILEWFVRSGYCSLHALDAPVERGTVTVTPVPLDNGYALAFVVDSAGKRLVHAPCHAMYLPDRPELRNADVLVMGMGTPDGKEPGKTSFADNLSAIAALSPRRAVLTHIEEDWKMGHDELVAFAGRYHGVEIAFDGMEIAL